MSEKRTSPYGCFDRRYLIELIPALVAMLVAVIIAWTVPKTPGVRLLLAGLASGALAYAIVVTVAAIRRLDELQQRVHLIAIATAFTVTGVLVALTRFLEAAGVRHVPSGMNLWTFMFVVWTIGVVVLNRRYR